MILVLVVVIVLLLVLVINVILTVNMCGSKDSGAGGCVIDKYDRYSKHVW